MLKVVVSVDLSNHLVETKDAQYIMPDVNLENILSAVSSELCIPVSDIKSKSREGELPDARKIYCLCAREYTNNSFKKIGKLVNIDHSTAHIAIKKARIYIKNEKEFRNKYNLVILKLI